MGKKTAKKIDKDIIIPLLNGHSCGKNCTYCEIISKYDISYSPEKKKTIVSPINKEKDTEIYKLSILIEKVQDLKDFVENLSTDEYKRFEVYIGSKFNFDIPARTVDGQF